MRPQYSERTRWMLWCGCWWLHDVIQGVKYMVNSSPPGQNGCHFADDIYTSILVNETLCIWITISLKFVPKGQHDNNLALVQIMAWHRIGDKPLSEPMLTWFTDKYAALGGVELKITRKDRCPPKCWTQIIAKTYPSYKGNPLKLWHFVLIS